MKHNDYYNTIPDEREKCQYCQDITYLPILDSYKWRLRIKSIPKGVDFINTILDIPKASASCPVCSDNRDYYRNSLCGFDDTEKALAFIVLLDYANFHRNLKMDIDTIPIKSLFGIDFDEITIPEWLLRVWFKYQTDIGNARSVIFNAKKNLLPHIMQVVEVIDGRVYNE